MSMLEQIKSAGLYDQLEALIVQYQTAAEADVASKSKGRIMLLDCIDKQGLKSAAVLKLVGALQRDKVLTPGMYKDLVDMSAKVAPTEPTAQAAQAAPAADSAAIEAVSGDGDVLTEKQQDRMKKRLAKAEDKMRNRLLELEKKIRDKFMGRAEKRATRQGMRLEELGEFGQIKMEINKKREIIQAVRAEIKELRAKANAIRPRKPRKSKTSESDAPEATA